MPSMTRWNRPSDRWQWKRDVANCSFQIILKRNGLKLLSYRLLLGRRGEKMFVVLYYSSTRLHTAELVLSRRKLSRRWKKAAHSTIGLRSRYRINPRPTRFVSGKTNECRWRPRRYRVDPWSGRREVARAVIRSSPKTLQKIYFSPLERDRDF